LVSWNSEPIGSTLLTEENAQNGVLEIAISPENLNKGFNALQIEFFMGIVEDFCIDYDNPAVWAVVHKDTSITLTYQKQAQESDLKLAPEILIDSSPLAENTITLIVPPDPGLEISQALARMGAKLGRMADWRNTDIHFMTMDQASVARPAGDLIILGTLDQINASFSDLYSQFTVLLSETIMNQVSVRTNDGLVFFQPSPFDPQAKVLTLTGDSLEALDKSVSAATLSSFYEGSSGTWSVVKSVPDLPEVPGSGELSFSLEDLGMGPQTASGTREQTIEFNLPLSAHWDVNTEAWLELHFAHSELLNSERSTLSVLLNDIPVASIPLTPDTATDGFEEIRIPLRYFRVGNNTFTLRANLEHRDSRQDARDFCTDETYPRAWITIHPDTAVVLPEAPGQLTLNLGSFPFGFADVYSYKNFSFVLGSQDTNAALSAMLDIAVSMGKALRGHPAGLSVRSFDEYEQAEGIKFHIMIGASEQMATSSLNDQLLIPIDPAAGSLQPNTTTLKIETPADILAVLQAFFDERGNIFLLLTGQDPQALAAGAALLTDPAARAALDGNLAVLTASDRAVSYQVSSGQQASGADLPPSPGEDQPLRLDEQSIWLVRISIGLVILSVIILIIALILKKPNAGEK
jgi:hypothetical protein